MHPSDDMTAMQVPVGVMGAGLIGRAWAIVFARAGVSVRLHDVDEQALEAAREALEHSLQDLAAHGLIDAPQDVLARIRFEPDLARAMADVGYVQECGPENLAAKRQIYAQLEAAVAPTTILASSTSGIAASRFTDHLQHPERCLVAHPVNPPYLIPLVEVVPTRPPPRPWWNAP